VDGCQSRKLALETSANFVATRAGNSRWIPARVSGKCVMGITLNLGWHRCHYKNWYTIFLRCLTQPYTCMYLRVR